MSIICITACKDFVFVSSDGLAGRKPTPILENAIKSLEIDGRFIVGATGYLEIISELFGDEEKEITTEEALKEISDESSVLDNFKRKYQQDNAKDMYNELFKKFAGPGKMKYSNQICVTGLDSEENIFVGEFNTDFEEKVIYKIITGNEIFSFALLPGDIPSEDYQFDHFERYCFEKISRIYQTEVNFHNSTIEDRISQIRAIHRMYIKNISKISKLVNKNIRHHKVLK